MAEKRIILAIDDDPMVLRVLTSLLSPAYDLRIAKSAADAKALLGQFLPDLILLDIEMPDVSGFDFLKALKNDPKSMAIPVVIVSGHCETEFDLLARHSGASSLVAKPIDKQDLIKKITLAFENSGKHG